jgi:hypothetical protein
MIRRVRETRIVNTPIRPRAQIVPRAAARLTVKFRRPVAVLRSLRRPIQRPKRALEHDRDRWNHRRRESRDKTKSESIIDERMRTDDAPAPITRDQP